MRHVVGFLVGLVLAPVVMLGAGWALPRLARASAAEATFLGAGGAATVAVLSVLALLVAVAMAAPRLTPLLPGVAGLALVGLSAAGVLRPELADRLPATPGLGGALDLLSLGVFVPVGLALVVPMFLASRWAGGERGGVSPEGYFDGLYDEDYEDHADDDADPGGRGRESAAAPRGGQHRRTS
ncbi:hypothetical protein HNR23_001859 [Nocardiopsis mwathae]|uniref:Uncharacterized protein n=1 Tax=Nocardiopsis mwathae TaxID=1472723 RepID=A0A7X0D666_9ACTN|nr:hypothetical protein [Nocardiopsis mwathae]MBB6171799.1 hypothetical protein [Nocardiopsis mwathae]